jgi:hypothetical protein
VVSANLRQPDAGIAGAAFYDEGVGIDLAGLQRPFDDGDTGTVLGATARIQAFQLREAVEMGGLENLFELDEWRSTDGPQYPTPHPEVVGFLIRSRSRRMKLTAIFPSVRTGRKFKRYQVAGASHQ